MTFVAEFIDDRYRIVKALGKGGMGTVYLANDERIDRKVAIKIPDEHKSSSLLQRFKREAKAIAKLGEHPNICSIFDYSDVPGMEYITMPYINGPTLSEIALPIPVPVAIEFVSTIADAMQFAHERDIVHRDLKPANIMLEVSSPIIMDFGLARWTEPDSADLTSDHRLGTLAYMAPEQFLADHLRVGPVSDVYGLGGVLYKLLTGRQPFPKDQLELKPTGCLPDAPSRLNPQVNQTLDDICAKALAFKIEDRFSSMQDFRKALDALGVSRSVNSPENITTANDFPCSYSVARQMQSQVARDIGHPKIQSTSTGIDLVLIPPGRFTMGSPANERGRRSDELQREVEISQVFWMGIGPVTQGQWLELMNSNPSAFAPSGRHSAKLGAIESRNLPVDSICWDEATRFCEQLTLRDQDLGLIPDDWSYQLPSEAQWEYAARAGTETATPFGQQPTDDTVNFARRMGRPNVSGDFSPNAWGLSDVVGNVYEWCSDTSTGGSALQRIARGGSWISSQSQARSASRKRLSINSRADDVGFRICLNTTRALLSDMSTKTAQRPPGV